MPFVSLYTLETLMKKPKGVIFPAVLVNAKYLF